MEGSTEGTVSGWHHISCDGSGSVENRSITSNGPIFSSNSTTKEVDPEQCMAHASYPNDNNVNSNAVNSNAAHYSMPPVSPPNGDANTIGSVGSRVPFSWAEITKIQPKFHNEGVPDNDHQKPKVFDQTPKIATRHPSKNGMGKATTNPNSKRNQPTQRSKMERDEIPMPSIPEQDPCANKSDLGRRVRKAHGKRGSRLKYINGKKGGNKNRRKKHTK